MSSSSRVTAVVASTGVTRLPWSVVVGRFGRVRVRRRQVREDDRPRAGGGVDAVPDRRAVSGVDELGEDRVHHVVVQGAATARPVRLAAPGAPLELEGPAPVGGRLGGGG